MGKPGPFAAPGALPHYCGRGSPCSIRGTPARRRVLREEAVAACHTTAATAADTDWADIAGLY
ncbi:hypothetical protein ABZ372_44825, partial [Streptomyces sp. NPDC005921]